MGVCETVFLISILSGKYDAPDRLFHSIQQCFASVLNNPADIKESIPQFYDPKGGVDFLLNTQSLQLGVTQTGTIINDVQLPPWAKSPRDFLKKNRKALESAHCTKFLPSWLDLIFGIKSRGEMAFEADNLFHPTAYLSPSDYEELKSDTEKLQAELQATEFGICPDVLFSAPHPQKNSFQNDTFISTDIGRSDISRDVDGYVEIRNDVKPYTGASRTRSPLTVQSKNQDRKDTHPLSPISSIMKYAHQMKSVASRDDVKTEEKSADETNDDIIEINASHYSIEDVGSSDSKGHNLLLSGTGESNRGFDSNGTLSFGSVEERQKSSQMAPEENLQSISHNVSSAQIGRAHV